MLQKKVVSNRRPNSWCNFSEEIVEEDVINNKGKKFYSTLDRFLRFGFRHFCGLVFSRAVTVAVYHCSIIVTVYHFHCCHPSLFHYCCRPSLSRSILCVFHHHHFHYPSSDIISAALPLAWIHRTGDALRDNCNMKATPHCSIHRPTARQLHMVTFSMH